MSEPGNRAVRPGVIYDWKTMVEMICEKVCFESVVKESRGGTGKNYNSKIRYHKPICPCDLREENEDIFRQCAFMCNKVK